jgi:hypothetical protein
MEKKMGNYKRPSIKEAIEARRKAQTIWINWRAERATRDWSAKSEKAERLRLVCLENYTDGFKDGLRVGLGMVKRAAPARKGKK